MLYWNPWVVSGLVSGSLVTALGLFVLLVGPPRLQSRAVSILLMAEGSAVAAGTWFMYSVTDARLSFVGQAYTLIVLGLTIPIYLVLLSTLKTPLVRPLGTPVARGIMGGLLVACFALVGSDPHRYVSPPVHLSSFAPRAAVSGLESGAALFLLAAAAVYLFGLIVAISAYRRATPGTTARSQARMFAWSFGLRDGLMTFGLLLMVAVAQAPFPVPTWFDFVTGNTLGNVFQLIYAPVLAYAILKHRLFDIDLKIKAAFRGSAVAAVFAAAFFIAAEAAETWIGIEGFWGGLLVAGLIALGLRPLHHWAGRLADAAMPRVQDTAEYRLVRKQEVYQAALESALGDGTIGPREEKMLKALAQQLGLDPEERRRLHARSVPTPAA